MMNINTKDISVVVQGAIDKKNTPKCLSSVRKYLKGAQIVLSTWEGSDVSGLDYDELLLNKDPGGFPDKFNKAFVNNTLRQLVSTSNGVEMTKNDFVLKIRSDLILKSNHFIRCFNQYQKRDDEYRLFKHRVLASSFFTKKYCAHENDVMPLPFHLSDWILFGCREDIVKIYDISLPEEPFNSWYMDGFKGNVAGVDLLHSSHRYAPEQYIFFNCCKKAFPEIVFDNYLDYSRDNIRAYDRILINNMIILDPNQWKFICGKEKTGEDYYKLWTYCPGIIPEKLKRGLYTNKEFKKDYEEYYNGKEKCF